MNAVSANKGMRILSAIAACLALASLTGCGGDSGKATISGKVTYKGAPVTGGTLTLYAESGTPYPVNINPNGTFNVSDVPTGQRTVSISTDNVQTNQGYTMPPGVTPPKDSPAPPQIDTSTLPKKVDIPAKYKDPKTSGLTWDIKGGKQSKDFDLAD